jgi:hypothetical protein
MAPMAQVRVATKTEAEESGELIVKTMKSYGAAWGDA